ncbi:MAG TPA: hypothetical protein DDY91_15980 [Planctomycetaceae bacterium]|nr:hypothetical protein [Planctomycetaceae bacterium]
MLLVMLALLLLLMVLGFTAFSFTSQEHESAQYYAAAAQRTGVEVDSNVLFDFGLEQILIGPNQYNQQSALWPGRHSLIPNMLGMFGVHPEGSGRTYPLDRHPYNGVGVNLALDPVSQLPFVDNDRDGLPDADSDLYLNFNYSPASHPQPARPPLSRDQILGLAAPDVDYTYPDLNNIFLAQVADVRVRYNDPTSIIPVIIPSFHRPQYLREKYENGNPSKPRARPDALSQNIPWDRSPSTVARLLRPHPQHVVVTTDAAGLPVFHNDPHSKDSSLPYYRRFPLLERELDLSPSDPDADGVLREQGIWSMAGSISSTDPRVRNYEYDVDTRGTGVRDGIWLDLGHAPFFLPDGRGVVPLFSFTILPADGLVNFNTAGNLSALAMGAMTTDKAALASLPVSRSNAGRSVSEINPFWALTADPQNSLFLNPPLTPGSTPPGNPFFQHIAFQKYTNSSEMLISRVELANLEMLFSQWGRPVFSGSGTSSSLSSLSATQVVAGRYGEESMILPGWNSISRSDPNRWLAFPRPGVPVPIGSTLDLNCYCNFLGGKLTGIPGDDDLNTFEGRALDGNAAPTRLDQHPSVAQAEAMLGTRLPLGTGPVTGQNVGHPLDASGAGNNLMTVAGGSSRKLIADPKNPLGPIRWPAYDHHSAGSQWEGAQLTGLVTNSRTTGLLDHPSEMIHDHRLQIPGTDQPFLIDELFHLHGSAADMAQAGQSSRLRQLLSFNLEGNLQASQIRQRFTTSSWDRAEHSQAWSSDPRQQWEFNADLDGDGLPEFPPVAGTPQDPREIFRTATRSWIGCEAPPTAFNPLHEQTLRNPLNAARNRQRRLDLNRVAALADRGLPPQVRTPDAPGIVENPVRFRRLTPHPVTTSYFNAVPDRSADQGPTYDTPLAQEFWARKDRQEMARDIYTLLYTLCGPEPVAGETLPQYTERQLVEMAQFAINVVDELDPDNTISRFEFDTDLGNGWNLDDNVDTVDPVGRVLPSGQVAVVYGVEAQALAFSEVLLVYQRKTTDESNHPATPYDDSVSDRWFTHVELQNVSPQPIALGSGGWRLSVGNPSVQPSAAKARAVKQPSDLVTSMVFLRDALNNSSQIAAGARYTVGSVGRNDGGLDTFNSGGTDIARSSDLRLDLDSNSSSLFQRLSPMVKEAVLPGPTTDAPPATNLDLVHSRDMGKNAFRLFSHEPVTTDVTDDSASRGSFLRGERFNPMLPLTIYLERRADLSRTGPPAGQFDPQYERDNPWITVDHFTVALPNSLPIQDSKLKTAELISLLKNLGSAERFNPLVVMERLLPSQGVASWGLPQLANTIGLNNSLIPASNTVWQPHFDRDFDSVIDLLRVPLYGPNKTTTLLSAGGQPLIDFSFSAGNIPTDTSDLTPSMAASKFLQPTHWTGVRTNGNRWYRLLDLFEVPPMGREVIAARFPQLTAESVSRIPGRLQLNAISHPENLFSLLDDPRTFAIQGGQGTPERIVDALESNREWWNEFTRTRDGLDPIVQLPLPGNPSARPFRSFSHAAAGSAKPEILEFTRLRRLGLDAAANNPTGSFDATTPTRVTRSSNNYRRLWEARTAADRSNNTVDPVSRNRLLGKVVNNSTTRSNVFMVWMTVGFFDAIFPVPQNPTIVQVGQELEDQSRRRGFFVLDRSLIEDALVPATQPGMPPTFDYRKFIQYRRELR